MKKRIRVAGLSFIFILALLLISAESASACTCPRPPHTAEDEFSESKVVGIFKLKSNAGWGWVFTAEKVYKGDVKVGDELKFRVSDCTIISRDKDTIGRDYLLYGSRFWGHEDALGFSPCSRSTRVEELKSDLLWLDKPEMRDKSRFSGQVWQNLDTAPYRKVLANWPITLKANGKVYSLITNSDGIYEVYGLPPGVYEVSLGPLKGYDYYRGDDPMYPPGAERTIYENSHAEWNISFSIETSITGRVVDANGIPLEGVEVALLEQNDKGTRRVTGKATLTGKDGYFELRTVPDGTFVIAVNDWEWATKRMPASGFSYASDGNFEKPTPITIKKGQIIKDLLITAPKVGLK